MQTSFQLDVAPNEDNPPRSLNRDDLISLFRCLSKKLLALRDGPPITIIVHGGAVFVCHFRSRETTQDVDYLSRRVESLYGSEVDTQVRLAIQHVAIDASMPYDWMNNDADTLIPLEHTDGL